MMHPYLKVAAVFAALAIISLAFPGCEALRGLQDEGAKNFWDNTNRQVGGGVQ